MATRSEVYIQEADGSLHGCYIHHDGYPSERGFECLAHAEAGTLRDLLLDNYRTEGWHIIADTDEQFIAKKGTTVAMANKI